LTLAAGAHQPQAKSQARLEAEIVFLRHQLNLLRRRLPAKPRLTPVDRLFFVWLYRLMPSLLNAAVIIQPDTIVQWHRAGVPVLLALEVAFARREAQGCG